MRSLKYLALFLLLIPFLAWADPPEDRLAFGGTSLMQMGTVAAAGGACTDDSGDTYNQGFEAAGTPTGWSVYGNTVDFNAARPGTANPAQLCASSMKTTGATSKASALYDYGSSPTTMYYRVYLYVPSGQSLTEHNTIGSWGNSGVLPETSQTLYMPWATDSSNYRLRLRGAVNGTWIGGITYDAWHLIEILVATNGTSTLKVDGTSNATDATAYNTAFRYTYIGGSSDNYTGIYYFDLFAVSTSGWIGAP